MKRRDYELAIEREVAEWPGVTVTFEEAGKHPRAIFTFGGIGRFTPFPGTPSDSAKGVTIKLSEVRRLLREMGAVRNERAKSDRPKPDRNPGADLREMPSSGPAPVVPDPWATLNGVRGKPLITEPGFYPNITCDQYFAEPCPVPALTNSGIKALLAGCPAKFAYQFLGLGQEEADAEDRSKATAAQHMGRLVHRLALDKGDDYAISPFDEYRSKEAKEWKAKTENRGIVPVKQAVFDDAQAMAATIREGIQRETRGEPYQTEVVMAWKREVNGFPIWCRAMLDVWCPSLGLALDVKTIVDAGDKSINKAFAAGYSIQDCFYSGGIEAINKQHGRTRFGFLFVEKEEPFLARYGDCDEAFRHGARLSVNHAAEIFARCMQSGEWPGYRPYTATPPVWWLNETADLELEEAA